MCFLAVKKFAQSKREREPAGCRLLRYLVSLLKHALYRSAVWSRMLSGTLSNGYAPPHLCSDSQFLKCCLSKESGI